jgi:phosphopantetheinyl transferase
LYLVSTELLGSEDQPSPVRRDLSGLLSRQEHDRFRRYLFAKDRDLYLLAHGLLRNLLTAYCPEARPWEWEFTLGDYGKPKLATNAEFQFNLSHAGQRAAVLLTRSVPCGVDIEPIREVPQCLEVSKRFFAAGEHRAVMTSDRPDRRFLEFWTAKEACAKTLGLGLKLDFGAFDLSTSTETLYLPETGIEPVRRHRVYRRGFIRKGYSVAVAFLGEKTTLSVFEPGTMLFGDGYPPPLSSSPSRPCFH